MSGRRRSFESIQVGDTATIKRTITAEDVRRFADLTGDDNPLHTDRAFAEASPFKDIVVHGMLGASLVSTLIGTELPGDGALWVSQSFEFLHPIRLDDTLTITGIVRGKNERERLLDLEANIVNDRNVAVLSGRGTVKVMAEPVESTEPAPNRPLVAIVTGGAGGIGRSIATTLAERGFAVVVGYRNHHSRADELIREIEALGGRATAVNVDVTDPSGVKAMVGAAIRTYGGIGVAIHAASPPIGPASFDDLRWADVAAHFETDARGAFELAKACVPAMREQGYGRIVAITSGELDGSPTPRWTAYAVGKAALATFARSLAVELGPCGITVNCVSPGMTDTAFVGDLSEKSRLVLARKAPLRRLASPQDVADAVAFLVSPGADYITGETLRVNGGQFTQ